MNSSCLVVDFIILVFLGKGRMYWLLSVAGEEEILLWVMRDRLFVGLADQSDRPRLSACLATPPRANANTRKGYAGGCGLELYHRKEPPLRSPLPGKAPVIAGLSLPCVAPHRRETSRGPYGQSAHKLKRNKS